MRNLLILVVGLAVIAGCTQDKSNVAAKTTSSQVELETFDVAGINWQCVFYDPNNSTQPTASAQNFLIAITKQDSETNGQISVDGSKVALNLVGRNADVISFESLSKPTIGLELASMQPDFDISEGDISGLLETMDKDLRPFKGAIRITLPEEGQWALVKGYCKQNG